MNRRDVLRRTGGLAGAGAMTSVAGCGILGGNCGPGEDEIGDLAEQAKQTESESEEETTREEFPRVVGTIKEAEQKEIIIDDGTGRASLQTISGGGFQMQNVGSGDCAYAEGVPVEPEAGTDADVTIYITEVGLEDE